MARVKYGVRLSVGLPSTETTVGVTRRQAMQAAGKVTASLAALSSIFGCELSSATDLQAPPENHASQPGRKADPGEKLRIATCQFPVSGNPAENAKYIREFMHKAAGRRGAPAAHVGGLPVGICRDRFPVVRELRLGRAAQGDDRPAQLAKDLKMWLVLGSAHFLDEQTKPTNCLYLIDPEGRIADRYDKCFCTGGDQKHYSVGDRLVTRDIRGVRIGLAICYDICWPQLYIAYREKGVTRDGPFLPQRRVQGQELPGHAQRPPGPDPLRRQSPVGRGQQLLAALFPLGIVHRPARRHDRQAVGDQSARHAGPRLPRQACPRAAGTTISSR